MGEGLQALLVRCQVLDRPHVVQAVEEFEEHDPVVGRYRTFLVQSGDARHESPDLGAELGAEKAEVVARPVVDDVM
ncbi:hypothetical protein [Nonomuraea sp. LPB2021202275-12-8]|uniref:hypothetical protein n=1 Tax=Nonomuraea sp. LPB2021202275-12-8 TaxID=3120159 RepID=UPI00300CAC2E